MHLNADVAIAGAGMGGATLALALARHGLKVVILEQAAVFKPLYRGEYLHPRSLQIFDELGLADDIRRVTYPVLRSQIGTIDGELLLEANLQEWCQCEGRNGHHREIQAVVLAALAHWPNAQLIMDARVTGLLRDEQNRVVGLSWSGGSVRAPLVVGADGRQSTVRQVLGVPVQEHPYEGAPLAVTVTLEADAPPEARQIFDEGECACFFPLPNRQARLYLLVTSETYTWMQGQPDRGLSYLQLRLSKFFPDLAVAIGQIPYMDDVQHVPAHFLLARRWTVPGAALLGDAAHSVSPVGGQGMNLAIADAWTLAQVLAEGRPLKVYEQRRRPFVRHVQFEGEIAFKVFTWRQPPLVASRNRIFRNTRQAQRATKLFIEVLSGVRNPPNVLQKAMLLAAFAFPPLDLLVPHR